MCIDGEVKQIKGEAPLGKIAQTSDTYANFKQNTQTDKQKKQRNQEKFTLQDAAARLMPKERVRHCMRRRISSDVAVVKTEHGAHFANVETCSSPWMCPVCSAKIALKRRDEVARAVHQHTSVDKGETYLLTLTFSHSRYDDLSDLVKRQRKAINYFNTSYAFKKFRKVHGMVGSIKALEVKHSDANGWHPHTHTILFVKTKVDDIWSKTLFSAWYIACEKAGLSLPNEEHGLDLKDARHVSEYITKFANEITMSSMKSDSKKESLSAFQLLSKYQNGCKRSGALFVEYANAFKGSRQLYWSPKLKGHFAIDEKTDAELNNEKDDKQIIVFKIDKRSWQKICKNKLRGVVINTVMYDPQNFDEFIYFVNTHSWPS